ncbi:MAG: hypothetical protein ACYCX3_11390 [Thermoleophilia bacterium]
MPAPSLQPTLLLKGSGVRERLQQNQRLPAALLEQTDRTSYNGLWTSGRVDFNQLDPGLPVLILFSERSCRVMAPARHVRLLSARRTEDYLELHVRPKESVAPEIAGTDLRAHMYGPEAGETAEDTAGVDVSEANWGDEKSCRYLEQLMPLEPDQDLVEIIAALLEERSELLRPSTDRILTIQGGGLKLIQLQNDVHWRRFDQPSSNGRFAVTPVTSGRRRTAPPSGWTAATATTPEPSISSTTSLSTPPLASSWRTARSPARTFGEAEIDCQPLLSLQPMS